MLIIGDFLLGVHLIQLFSEGSPEMYLTIFVFIAIWLLFLFGIGLVRQLRLIQLEVILVGRTLEQFTK